MSICQKFDTMSFVQALVLYIGIGLSRTKSPYNENILRIKAPLTFMQVARRGKKAINAFPKPFS